MLFRSVVVTGDLLDLNLVEEDGDAFDGVNFVDTDVGFDVVFVGGGDDGLLGMFEVATTRIFIGAS